MKNSSHYIELEHQYGAHIYDPIPVVLDRGQGVYVWDVEDNRYIDCLSGYSSLNVGHCHPRLLKVLQEQASKLTITARAFYNSVAGSYEKFITEYFSYERVLPMNTGAEAVETGLKLCRKWGYQKKNIPANQAKVLFFESNFHGRTLAVISASSNSKSRKDFGPYLPGLEIIPYNDITALEKAIQAPEVAGMVIEPIQGEAGVIIPDDSYLKKAYELCKKHNALFIADEIQTGLGRTGTMLACDRIGIRPHILLLAKALSGGMLPISAVLADSDIMDCLQPGEHGSTYGGNPLACRIAMETLSLLKEEKLVENSEKMGAIFREQIGSCSYPWIKELRGRGLLNALEIVDGPIKALDFCLELKKNGILAIPMPKNTIRFSPPLSITEEEMKELCERTRSVMQAMHEKHFHYESTNYHINKQFQNEGKVTETLQ